MITNKTLKNSFFTFVSYSILGVMAFVVRRLFLQNIDEIYLGYESFINNIFEILLVLSLGIDNVIYYKLVKAYGENDEQEFNILFNIYRSILKYCLVILSFLSLVVILFSVLVINVIEMKYDTLLIYLFLLVAFVLQQYINLYRMIFVVVQTDYKCVFIDFLFQLICIILKIFAISFFGNYLLYVCSSVICVAGTFFLIRMMSSRDYYQLTLVKKISKNDVINRNIHHDVSENLVQKISLAIYGGTDYLVITLLIGIRTAAHVSNFVMISNALNNGLCKMFDPFQPAIGKSIYDKDIDKERTFNAFNYLGFFISFYVFSAFLLLSNDFVGLFMGDIYRLDSMYVAFFSLNQYVAWNHKFLAYYRNSFGKYEIDRTFILVGTLINVVLSVTLSGVMGVSGVMLGTFIGHIGFWIGRIIVVHKCYLQENVIRYVGCQIKYLCMLIVNSILLLFLFSYKAISWNDFIIKFFGVFVVTSFVFIFGSLLLGERNKIVDLRNMFLHKKVF